jgi:hypothetical protein
VSFAGLFEGGDCCDSFKDCDSKMGGFGIRG